MQFRIASIGHIIYYKLDFRKHKPQNPSADGLSNLQPIPVDGGNLEPRIPHHIPSTRSLCGTWELIKRINNRHENSKRGRRRVSEQDSEGDSWNQGTAGASQSFKLYTLIGT
jgi:hypothetical protein